MKYNLEPKYYNAVMLARSSDGEVSFHGVPHYAADELERIVKGYNDATVSRQALMTDSGRMFETLTASFEHAGKVTMFLKEQIIPKGYKVVKDEPEMAEEINDEVIKF